jgi:hypothetical protein
LKDTIDFQDELFDLFRFDTELCALLPVLDSANIEECDTKIKRIIQDPTIITADGLPFFDYTFTDAIATGNYKVNKGYLEFNIYAGSRYIANLIAKATDRIIKANYEGLQKFGPIQVGCPVKDILQFRVIYKPLVAS